MSGESAVYRAVSRLKLGAKEYIERGEKVLADDVDDIENLVKTGSVALEQDFVRLFPEFKLDGAEPVEEETESTPSGDGTEEDDKSSDGGGTEEEEEDENAGNGDNPPA